VVNSWTDQRPNWLPKTDSETLETDIKSADKVHIELTSIYESAVY